MSEVGTILDRVLRRSKPDVKPTNTKADKFDYIKQLYAGVDREARLTPERIADIVSHQDGLVLVHVDWITSRSPEGSLDHYPINEYYADNMVQVIRGFTDAGKPIFLYPNQFGKRHPMYKVIYDEIDSAKAKGVLFVVPSAEESAETIDFIAKNIKKRPLTISLAAGGQMADHCLHGNLVELSRAVNTSFPGETRSIYYEPPPTEAIGKIDVISEIV